MTGTELEMAKTVARAHQQPMGEALKKALNIPFMKVGEALPFDTRREEIVPAAAMGSRLPIGQAALNEVRFRTGLGMRT